MLDTSPVIRVRHLSHCFGPTEVLHDVGFDVGRAEIFGFIGPNGAGKTTTIRAMATLLEPTTGRIEVLGMDVVLEPERVRPKIGYMADQTGVYPKLTVEEYLTFFAAAYRLNPPAAVEAALDLTGFSSARDELTGRLSKGMRQRLQLAKTLLHDPEVLILDEPASDLDPRARIEMRDLFFRLRDAGKTIFLSSHILSELSDVCTSVGVLERGRLLAYGPVAEIAQRLGQEQTAVTLPAPSPEPRRPPRGFRLRTLGPAEPARRVVEALPSVAHVKASGDELVVAVHGDDGRMAELVAALVTAGIGVIGVEPERNELEAVFLELTRKDGP